MCLIIMNWASSLRVKRVNKELGSLNKSFKEEWGCVFYDEKWECVFAV